MGYVFLCVALRGLGLTVCTLRAMVTKVYVYKRVPGADPGVQRGEVVWVTVKPIYIFHQNTNALTLG